MERALLFLGNAPSVSGSRYLCFGKGFGFGTNDLFCPKRLPLPSKPPMPPSIGIPVAGLIGTGGLGGLTAGSLGNLSNSPIGTSLLSGLCRYIKFIGVTLVARRVVSNGCHDRGGGLGNGGSVLFDPGHYRLGCGPLGVVEVDNGH